MSELPKINPRNIPNATKPLPQAKASGAATREQAHELYVRMPDLSLDAVAKRLGLEFITVREWAEQGGWVAERQAAQAEMAESLQAKRDALREYRKTLKRLGVNSVTKCAENMLVEVQLFSTEFRNRTAPTVRKHGGTRDFKEAVELFRELTKAEQEACQILRVTPPTV